MGRPLPAGLFVGNGFGKFVGATQVIELGQVETPIMLTSTLSAFAVAEAVVAWALDALPEPPTTLNPVVGEVNDSWLCGRAPRVVTAGHVRAALEAAAGGPVAMDCVEEATLDALLGASTVRAPSGRVAHAFPRSALR